LNLKIVKFVNIDEESFNSTTEKHLLSSKHKVLVKDVLSGIFGMMGSPTL